MRTTTFYTAPTINMKLVPMFTKINVTVLSKGDLVTTCVEYAIIAFNFIECDRVLRTRFNILPFTKIDREEVRDTFNKACKYITLLDVGASMVL